MCVWHCQHASLCACVCVTLPACIFVHVCVYVCVCGHYSVLASVKMRCPEFAQQVSSHSFNHFRCFVKRPEVDCSRLYQTNNNTGRSSLAWLPRYLTCADCVHVVVHDSWEKMIIWGRGGECWSNTFLRLDSCCCYHLQSVPLSVCLCLSVTFFLSLSLWVKKYCTYSITLVNKKLIHLFVLSLSLSNYFMVVVFCFYFNEGCGLQKVLCVAQ